MGSEPTRSAPQPPSWLVVNTHPHKELFALENLVRQEFRVYHPRLLKRIRHARRSRDVMRSLFPGYLFVEFNPDAQRWRPILSTVGVRALVRCGKRLSYLDPAFIASLKAREVDGAIIKPERPYRIGQPVRFIGGEFDGIVATIIELSENDRLVVLMDILNRSVRVNVGASQVTAA